MEEDDDIPQLSSDTLQLLQQFNEERDARSKQFEELKAQSEQTFQDGSTSLSMNLFGEDWNASQFWYTDETASVLAKQLLDGAANDSVIAVVSAPSVYVQLRNLLSRDRTEIRPRLYLLEYDSRFNVFGTDFVQYDFQHPLRIPAELKGKCDRIICDPPFLSEDCQTKTALSVRYLARSWASPSDSGSGLRFITCTGERMELIISKLYSNINIGTTTFEPEHSKGLSNEFRCYANFECEQWKWK